MPHPEQPQDAPAAAPPSGDPGASGPWARWLATAPGRYLLQWETAELVRAVDNRFGYYAVQLGMPALDALAANRMPHRIRVLAGTAPVPLAAGWQPDLRVRHYGELPFASQSVDLVILPHTLEFSPCPHQLLREVDRILRPEGHVVITGINPWSLWGVRHALPGWLGGGFLPHEGPIVGAARVRDWIRLLGFEPAQTVYGGYAWPVDSSAWLTRGQRLLERAGERWWPVCGAVYLVCAVKRVRGMRLVGPVWRGRSPATAPLPAATREGISCSVLPSRPAHPGRARRGDPEARVFARPGGAYGGD